jgi:hypothetical protein
MHEKRSTWGLWLRLLCAIALLSIGFQHRAMAFSTDIQANSAAYVLPDGTISSLCAPGESDQRPAPGGGKYGCEACRLAAGANLAPAPQVAVRHDYAADVDYVDVRSASTVSKIVLTDSAPRAPPVFS